MGFLITLLFSSCIFLSAFLLFSVQPMVGKAILPLLGGTPQVWNTCMFFFQLTLLAGYYYAHLVAKLGARGQALIHVILLAAAAWVLPSHSLVLWDPPTISNPVLWLLSLLTVSIGLPFFMLAANSPLLQKWFSHTPHPGREDPYFLYAASNTGSLLALLSYPFFLEPRISLSGQFTLWSLAYTVFVVITLICLFVFLRSHSATPEPPPLLGNVSRKQRGLWIALAFVPASLMYGVTTYLTTDIAAFPLLWIIPLSLYLLTFILAFAKRSSFLLPLTRQIFPWVVIPLVVILAIGPRVPMKIAFSWNLFGFFVLAMFCHGSLAASRPPVRHLTEFYLWLSIGGVLGGAFNSLLAPVIFHWPIEYQIAIILACLLRTKSSDLTMVLRRWIRKILPAAFGIFLLGVCAYGLFYTTVLQGTRGQIIFIALAILVLFLLWFRVGRLLLGILSLFFMGLLFFINPNVEYSNRSFFGVHRIKTDHNLQLRSYLNGSVVHGIQSLDRDRSQIPSTYYHPTGPAGDIVNAFRNQAGPKKVAVVGLGIGSMAVYGQEGETWTFYEIDPVVKQIAQNEKYFTYLKDSAADIEIILGDGRLKLAEADDYEYGLILIDAFSSDSIPLHLITKEAVRLYMQKLSQNGILAFHISNQYLNLEPALSAIGNAVGLITLARKDIIDESLEAHQRSGKKSSIWMIMVKNPATLGLENVYLKKVKPAGPPKKKLWTDNHSDILRAMQW